MSYVRRALLVPLLSTAPLAPLVALAGLAACDDAPAAAPEAPTRPVGKGDGVLAAARPSCVEEPTRPGLTTPLLRDLDDPHRYYTLPTRWVVEDASATYWLASSFQYFDPRDAAGFERYGFTSHLSLQDADAPDDVLAVLAAEDPEARVEPLPLARSSLDELTLTLLPGTTIGERRDWDAAALAADVELDLSREGVEAAVTFFAERAPVQRVAATLAFACDDGFGPTTREVHPQAGVVVVLGYDGVPVDDSTGTVTGAADQIMVSATLVLPYHYAARLPEDDLAAILRPLLAYDASFPVEDVRAAGAAVEAVVAAWADERRAEGVDEARLEADLFNIEHHVARLASFEPSVRVHPLAAQ